jgi:hypothetical protein
MFLVTVGTDQIVADQGQVRVRKPAQARASIRHQRPRRSELGTGQSEQEKQVKCLDKNQLSVMLLFCVGTLALEGGQIFWGK